MIKNKLIANNHIGAGCYPCLSQKECQKTNHGITLIALIVTIIVLLILAGISLNLINGSNGILTKAENAATVNSKANAQEELELIVTEIQMDNFQNGTVMTLSTLAVDLDARERIDVDEYTEGQNLTGTYQARDRKSYRFRIYSNFVVEIIDETEVVEEISEIADDSVPEDIVTGGSGGGSTATTNVLTLALDWSDLASNEKGKVILSKTADVGTIEYKITSSGSWTEGAVASDLDYGTWVYGRIKYETTSGVRYTVAKSIHVIDNIKPESFTLSTTDLQYNAFTISGSTIDNQTGLTNYTFIVTDASGETEILREEETTDTEFEVTNLSNNTTYNVRMIAYDEKGNSRISNLEVTTKNRVYLYNNGDECISVTGGWVSSNSIDNGWDDTIHKYASISRGSSYMTISLTGDASGYNYSSAVLPQNSIDYSGFKTLSVKYSGTLNKYSLASGAIFSVGKGESDFFVNEDDWLLYTEEISAPITRNFNITSAFSSSDNIFIWIQAGGAGWGTLNLYEMYIEN